MICPTCHQEMKEHAPMVSVRGERMTLVLRTTIKKSGVYIRATKQLLTVVPIPLVIVERVK